MGHQKKKIGFKGKREKAGPWGKYRREGEGE